MSHSLGDRSVHANNIFEQYVEIIADVHKRNISELEKERGTLTASYNKKYSDQEEKVLTLQKELFRLDEEDQ